MVLDPYGSHAASCDTAVSAVMWAHNAVANVIRDFARRAGMYAIGGDTGEPATHDFLMKAYDRKLLSQMFPKSSNAQAVAKAKKFVSWLPSPGIKRRSGGTLRRCIERGWSFRLH